MRYTAVAADAWHPLCEQELMMKLAGMEAELRSNTAKKEQLEADIGLCSVKLVR